MEMFTIQERLEHFMDHFKMAKIEKADFMELNDGERALVEDFHDVVLDKCKSLLSGSHDDYTIYGATKHQAIGREYWRARELTFCIVEITECRLLNDNSLAGLSLNEINYHYSFEIDMQKPFCFLWRLPLLEMQKRIHVPTLEYIKAKKEDYKWMSKI